jgi:hypothetical protein
VAERRHNLLTDEVISLRKEKAALVKRMSADERKRGEGGHGGQGERGGGEGGGAAGGEIEELRRALIDKDARVAYLEKEIGEGGREPTIHFIAETDITFYRGRALVLNPNS